jgi:hypothetical protein
MYLEPSDEFIFFFNPIGNKIKKLNSVADPKILKRAGVTPEESIANKCSQFWSFY